MDSSDDDSDVPGNQSSTQVALDFDSNELKTIISNMVQYVITNSQKKFPIKKQNLSKDCLHGRGRSFKPILDKVNENLDKIFGMRLEEIPNKSVQQYILVNTLDILEPSYFDKSPEDHLLNGVLLPVLAVIFMLKGKTKEDVIFNFLKTLGLDVESKQKFGPFNYTLKQLLTNYWVKQQYLEYYKDRDLTDDPVYIFNWGFRSELEINKKALLTFVSRVYDVHVCPETWHEQYEQALANHRIGEEEMDD